MQVFKICYICYKFELICKKLILSIICNKFLCTLNSEHLIQSTEVWVSTLFYLYYLLIPRTQIASNCVGSVTAVISLSNFKVALYFDLKWYLLLLSGNCLNNQSELLIILVILKKDFCTHLYITQQDSFFKDVTSFHKTCTQNASYLTRKLNFSTLKWVTKRLKCNTITGTLTPGIKATQSHINILPHHSAVPTSGSYSI